MRKGQVNPQELLRRLRELHRQLTLLTAQAARMEERIYSLTALLEEQIGILCEMMGNLPLGTVHTPAPSNPPQDVLLAKAALKGVGSVRLGPTGRNGSKLVVIDDEDPFVLPETPAEFLALLLDAAPAEDGFPRWQTKAELAALLETRLHRRFTLHGVSHLRYRLAKRLCAEGHNPHLVMTSSEGIRFALRHTDNPTT